MHRSGFENPPRRGGKARDFAAANGAGSIFLKMKTERTFVRCRRFAGGFCCLSAGN
jgi:hypothetical protein